MNLENTSIRSGLCSVTFRHLSCEEIIALAKRAGLSAIEWGTDVHLPPNNQNRAREIAALCVAKGLATHTIGSYLRCNNDDDADLNSVIDIAKIMGSKRIRVWAGQQGSADASHQDRNRVTTNLARYCNAAEEAGISIALEHHPDTLTDTAHSSAMLLKQVDHSALFTYWQPTPDLSVSDAIEQIQKLQPWLCDLHVFHWVADKQRRPLEEGREFWQAVFAYIQDSRNQKNHAPFYAFLEFVRRDDLEQCLQDATVLNSMCNRTTDPKKTTNNA